MTHSEALWLCGKAQERVAKMARGRGGRAQLASYAREAEALHIVLAMAKAAESLAWALDKHLPPAPDFSTRAGEAVTVRARAALDAYREALK